MTKRLLLIVAVLVGVGAAVFLMIRQQRGAPVSAATSGDDGHAAQSEEQPGTPRSDIALDTRRQQLIGVRTVRVERGSMAPDIRAAGTVAYDETRQVEVNTRVDGWIRDLYADYTGRTVRRDDPLFTLYSPDLIAEQNEYLLALHGASTAPRGDANNVADYADRLAAAARERLLRLEISPAEIDQLVQTGRAAETITFRSPANGIIVEKTAVRGMRVTAGQMLYRLADLSTVWVEAEVYETDLPAVRVGARAVVSLQAYPDRTFAGRVAYIYPAVTPETRTVRVRLSLANPEGLLKPNMLATVTLQAPQSNGLLVPADAVVDTGTQQLVFVAEGDGRFSPREVRLGRRLEGKVEVLSGVKEGDAVAASATFFLDSESQLRGALQNYAASPAPPGAASTAALNVTFRTEPEPPHTGDTTFVVTVKDAGGQPIADADASVVLFMPAMPSMNMPAMKSETKLVAASGGVYRGTGRIMTPGRWDVTVTVSRAGKPLGARQFAVVPQ